MVGGIKMAKIDQNVKFMKDWDILQQDAIFGLMQTSHQHNKITVKRDTIQVPI